MGMRMLIGCATKPVQHRSGLCHAAGRLRMNLLSASDRAALVDLIGEALAAQDEAAVAAAIDDLRADLPAFRHTAMRMIAEESAR